MDINVLSFSDRIDLKMKQLLVFLKSLHAEQQGKADKPIFDVANLTIELKTVRKYKQVIAGNTNLTFDLGNRNLLDGETYIDNSDAFMPIATAFGICKTSTVNAATSPANNEIFSYPDKTVFDDQTVAASPPEWQALMPYYWATWQLIVNNKTVITQLHSERLLKVAQVQQFDDAAAMRYVQGGRYAPLYNTPLLDGNKTIEMSVKAPAGVNTDNAGGAAAETNYGVLDVHGLVVKDLSTAMNALNEVYYWIK